MELERKRYHIRTGYLKIHAEVEGTGLFRGRHFLRVFRVEGERQELAHDLVETALLVSKVAEFKSSK